MNRYLKKSPILSVTASALCLAGAFAALGILGAPCAHAAFEMKSDVADALGKGIVIASESDISTRLDNGGFEIRSQNLNITRRADDGSTVWIIRDGVNDCDVDGFGAKILDRTRMTDLDGDGLSEIWTAYTLECRSDPSPTSMKIIMYEGTQKHAMRGETRVTFSIGDGKFETQGGEYEFDPSFRQAPENFRRYAKKLWDRLVAE